jgi:hypothetical protein
MKHRLLIGVIALALVTLTPGVAANATSSDSDTAPSAEIGGTAAVGSMLAVNLHHWADETTFSYVWSADGSQLKEPGRYLTPALAQLHKHITVQVTGTKSGSAKIVIITTATGPVVAGTFPDGVVGTSGSAVVGHSLTTTLVPYEYKYRAIFYQWLRGTDPIAGATNKSYKVTAADLGSTISVRAFLSAQAFWSTTETSAPTDRVTN